MPRREQFLLIATIAGFLMTNVWVIVFVARNGLVMGDYFGAWVGTMPSAQITVDLAMCGVIFLVWSFWDARRERVSRWWLTPLAIFLGGLCMAIPLYLYLRERTISRRSAPQAATV
jgi:ABC-type proline/glycine betaine transport system permease subunit